MMKQMEDRTGMIKKIIDQKSIGFEKKCINNTGFMLF